MCKRLNGDTLHIFGSIKFVSVKQQKRIFTSILPFLHAIRKQYTNRCIYWSRNEIFTEQPQKHYSDALLIFSCNFLSSSLQTYDITTVHADKACHCTFHSILDGGGGQSNKSAESASYLDRLGAHKLMNKGYPVRPSLSPTTHAPATICQFVFSAAN